MIYTARDKWKCAERELRYRISVYGRRVADGKMSERESGREIAIMSEIVEDYRREVEQAEPKLL